MKRAVFLDRDGVLNKAFVVDGKSYPPATLEAFELLEGVTEACERLSSLGFMLVVVTNQPDVRTGKQSRAVVEAMHAQLCSLLPIDAVYSCFHTDADACGCRKPLPGMILSAAEEHSIEVRQSFMVGDRWRDVAAGQRAGCGCYFIDYGYSEQQPEGSFVRVTSLFEAVTHIAKN